MEIAIIIGKPNPPFLMMDPKGAPIKKRTKQAKENEGDFIAAAECVTPEMINFMAKNGRGLICAPLTEARCEELDLPLMVNNNTVLHNTPFTVSIDLIGQERADVYFASSVEFYSNFTVEGNLNGKSDKFEVIHGNICN